MTNITNKAGGSSLENIQHNKRMKTLMFYYGKKSTGLQERKCPFFQVISKFVKVLCGTGLNFPVPEFTTSYTVQ